jgi:molybdopterin/thiamine biosynthesis adenylyltransferase
VNETRYARQIVLPEVGLDGQQRLSSSQALIVGLGGLGCPAAQLLASCGVGTLQLNDFDTVDESNLPRQILFAPEDAGRSKVQVAAERLRAMNPEVHLQTIDKRLSAEELAQVLHDTDVVLDGTDNFMTRFAVSDACSAARVPLVSGAAIRLEGQVAVFRNDRQGPCYRCIYSEDDEWLGDCQGNGVLAPVTATIGSMMALEAVKLLLGLDTGPPALQLWDARSNEWTRVAVRRNPDCPHCRP